MEESGTTQYRSIGADDDDDDDRPVASSTLEIESSTHSSTQMQQGGGGGPGAAVISAGEAEHIAAANTVEQHPMYGFMSVINSVAGFFGMTGSVPVGYVQCNFCIYLDFLFFFFSLPSFLSHMHL